MKKLLIFLSIPIFILLFQKEAYAKDKEVVYRQNWNADENIVNFVKEFEYPKRIILVPITFKYQSSDKIKQIQDLYYFYVTRGGVGDLPYHYVVYWDGTIFEGNSLGTEAKIKFGDVEDALFVGYIKDSKEGFSISSLDDIEYLILKIMNKYAIAPENISVKEMNYEMGPDFKIKKITFSDASSIWSEQIEEFDLKSKYEPIEMKFSAQVVSVVAPEETLEMATTAEVKIKVKNTGDLNFYSSPGSNLYIARNNPFDKKSSFYLPNVWDSHSRVALLQSGENLFKEEEKEFLVKVFVPLYYPQKSEDFILVDPNGKPIKGSDFKISLNISKTGKTVIEITDTPIGYLNVRETPGKGEVVTKVLPVERYIVLDYKDGYYKINADGKEGWVVNTYVKVI